MALGILTLNDTFQLATVTRLNSLILFMNELTEGQHNSSGIITLSGGGFRDNVTLNVSNGQLKGDGGALFNIGASFTKIAGQANNTIIQNNYVNLVSNIGSLIIVRGNTNFGNTTYFTLNTTSSIADVSTSNIAVIGAVNTVSNVATAAYNKANAANVLADGQSTAIAASFAKANAANVLAAEANTITVANTLANGYALIRSSLRSTLNFREDLTLPDIKINLDDDSAGDRANITFAAPGIGLAFAKANAANITADANRFIANLAYDKANVANATADSSFARANADIISLVLNGGLNNYTNVNAIPYCTFAFQIDYAYYRLDAGTSVRIQVRNGSTNVTNQSALTATTAPSRNNATGLNTFAIGDRLQLTITNSTSAEKNLEMAFAITRT